MYFRSFLFYFVAIFFKNIQCYNKTIMSKDYVDCVELHLEQGKHSNTDIVVAIADLIHNEARNDEMLRMKAFFLGTDFYIEMMPNSNKPIYHDPQIRFYHTVLGGWGGNTSMISVSAAECPFQPPCKGVNTEGLFHPFYFTELEIVVKKNGLIQYFEHGNLKISRQLEPIAITHLAFGIGELGDGRVFFDCPLEDMGFYNYV